MARSPLTIITTIWRVGEKNLQDTPTMELPLVNEPQDLNSNPDARVRELSGERPLVVRIKRVVETSCTSLVILMLVDDAIRTVIFCILKFLVKELHLLWVRSERLCSDVVLTGYSHTSKSMCAGPFFGTEANWH